MEHKLSKNHTHMVFSIAKRKEETQKLLLELLSAEKEQLQMIISSMGLPEGSYKIRQEELELFLIDEPGEKE